MNLTKEGILIEIKHELLDLQFIFPIQAYTPAACSCGMQRTSDSQDFPAAGCYHHLLHPCSLSSDCPPAVILKLHYTGIQTALFPFPKPQPYKPGCWFKWEYLQVCKTGSQGGGEKKILFCNAWRRHMWERWGFFSRKRKTQGNSSKGKWSLTSESRQTAVLLAQVN